jgi:hypothetical protein
MASSGVGVFVLVTKLARYSRIGSQVTCYFDLVLSSVTGGSNSDTLTLTGLPFVSAVSTLGYVGSLFTSLVLGVSGGGYAVTITGSVPASSSTVTLWNTNSVSTALKQDSFKVNSEISGIISYLADV